ncbi:hypothetical protein AMES_7220 [Amycolatopsis mediterranei S699]|uniref:Uncharacterized protein n=3 Tax=Amycolatopsis mediterranei TaxID=33910 RepID=A0A0H3DDM7_AMYMU|nr:hypothetical protein AMED_7330 [Amycolatopsis mediterranei U32]AEK46003.1 hypothetical protein RAM_37680 [Amycolatopsis mediterranei S699]AGT87881.1 hypothetical protein B737_7220 [Amycolatopsis mediterranei RB]KDO04024.1 hypothetical protein DV26_45910 [Amycolatopsis mediterranei]AFO80753.1 hypothetical protein AMES_7220 [Amycolatopsis mediterranei S699]
MEKQMWAVTGYGRDESLVFEQDLPGLGEDELARLLGGSPGEYQGGDVAISAESRELLADRHGIRFEPDVEYFLSYFRDYPGQVVGRAGDDGRQ